MLRAGIVPARINPNRIERTLIVTTYIERTNNPLLILACMAVMALSALAGVLYRTVAAVVAFTVRFVVEHHRVLLLCLAVVAVPVVINLAWPFVVAVAGKLLAGSALTSLFSVVFRVLFRI